MYLQNTNYAIKKWVHNLTVCDGVKFRCLRNIWIVVSNKLKMIINCYKYNFRADLV